MIKENSFDAAPGTCLSTAKPISSPAWAGPEKPASIYQLIGGLCLLDSLLPPPRTGQLSVGTLKTKIKQKNKTLICFLVPSRQ